MSDEYDDYDEYDDDVIDGEYDEDEPEGEVVEIAPRRRPAKKPAAKKAAPRKQPQRRRVPANAPQPQDRKPPKKTAREAEAEDGFIHVTIAGVDLDVPVNGKLPLKAAIAFNRGDEFGGTEILMGTEQWERFLDADPTIDDYQELSEAIAEAVGN